MSLFVNAAPFEENSNTIENKKKQRNHTLKKPQKLNYLQLLLTMMIVLV